MHFAVAPVGSVLPEAAGLAEPADLAGTLAPGEAGAEVAAGAAALEAGAAALEAAAGALEAVLEPDAGADVCTPPWLLQAPRPVAVEVVPSLHVVGAGESAAQAAWLQAKISNGTAAIRASMRLFIVVYSSVRGLLSGNSVITSMRKRVWS